MTFDLVQVTYTAAILGSAYSLMSAGLTLTWGGLGFLNLAYGALYTLGGFTTYWLVTSNNLPAFLGLFVSFIGVAAVGTGLGNYAINYVKGKLAVNAAALTITAKDESKTYGAVFTPDGATQFTPSG